MLRAMVEMWLDLLAEYGWETPVADLTWCSTALDNERAQFEIKGQKTLRTSSSVGFKVLGTRANNAFFANWALLGCISVPLKTRIRVFKAVVDATIFWCAGSWTLTREQNERLRTFQMRLLRRLLRKKD